ncbi:MAG: VWA domain-containing protein [Myxococcales bacterium]|nr:VWA domain-containing protein [Myxococcales bacterium]
MRISFILVSALISLACGASPGGGRGGARDGGGGGAPDGGASGEDGGGVVHFDAGPPPPWSDAGPMVDAGCDLASPVETAIIGDPPDMLLTVDISGSMCLGVGLVPGGESKMLIMQRALTDVVSAFEARINFGMMLFPSDNTCGAGTVRNPIAPRNASAITTTLNGLTTDTFSCALRHQGATPTHTSIDAARSYYAPREVNPIGQYVLLATDGLPNCGAPLPDGGTEETVDETVAAIEALFAAGVRTYVLGFGADFTGGGTALNRMAAAGGTGTPYNARSDAELRRALEMIAAAIIPPSCTVELSGPTRDPRLFQVRFDGGPLIPRNEARTSGWDYDAATNTITFYGPECTRLQGGTVVSVDVDFGCPGPLI